MYSIEYNIISLLQLVAVSVIVGGRNNESEGRVKGVISMMYNV
jgi:hypothetical protein